MELTDGVEVVVTARDDDAGSGIMRLGYSVLPINGAPLGTLVQVHDTTYATPVTGAPEFIKAFNPFNVEPLALPDSVRFVVYAFAVDSAGNCSAAVANIEQQLACVPFGN